MKKTLKNSFDDIRLSQEKKEQMLDTLMQETAAGKRRARKWLSAAAGIALAICVGSGIGYAATGQTPARFLTSFFQKEGEHAGQDISAGFTTVNETFLDRGIQYTAEQYFYDAKDGTAFVQIHIRPVKEQPFLSWKTAYQYGCEKYQLQDSFDGVEEWRQMCQMDKAQMDIYKEIVQEKHIFGDFIIADSKNAGTLVRGDSTLEFVNDREAYLYLNFEKIDMKSGQIQIAYQNPENETVWTSEKWNASGEIASYEVELPKKKSNMQMSVNGYSISVAVDQSVFDAPDIWPFQKLELTMKDGTVYYFSNKQKTSDVSENRHLLSYYSQVDIVKDKTFLRFWFENGYQRVCIDMDAVKSLKMDGQTCKIK